MGFSPQKLCPRKLQIIINFCRLFKLWRLMQLIFHLETGQKFLLWNIKNPFYWLIFLKPFLAFYKEITSNFASSTFFHLIPSIGTTKAELISQIFPFNSTVDYSCDIFPFLPLTTLLFLILCFFLRFIYSLNLIERRRIALIVFLL